jgi:hypothetical protein
LNVKRAAAHFAQQPTKIWESRRFALGQIDDFTSLFVNPEGGSEDRLIYQGVFYLFAATDLPSLTACGTLYIDYEIEFSIASLIDVGTLRTGYLLLESSTTGTPSAPLSAAVVSPANRSGFPVDSIEYTYTGGASSIITLRDLEPASYAIESRWQLSAPAGTSSTSTVSTTWQILSSGATWSDLSSAITQTNVGLTPTGGTYAMSIARNNFAAIALVTAFGDFTFQVTASALAAGWTYGSNLMQLKVIKLATPAPSSLGHNPRTMGKRANFVMDGRKYHKQQKNSYIPEKPVERPALVCCGDMSSISTSSCPSCLTREKGIVN